MNSPTTRFAPSPSGFLHLGNVRTALFSLLAAQPDGRFLIRMEDTDRERVDRRFEDAALADLEWLGFGPFIDRAAILYQSARTAIYDDYLAKLVAAKRAYPCFCSPASLAAERAEAQARGRPPRYSGRCAKLSAAEAEAHLALGEHAVWRFRVPAGEQVAFLDVVRGPQVVATDLLGDFVVRRTNGEPMFFFTNALDDALSGVTLVLRGEDHLSNTARQILLLKALDLPVPEYGHLPLVLNEAGVPLSKRDGAGSVGALRAEGFLPTAVINYLARLGAVVGSDALLSIQDLAAAFDPARIGHAPARYDRQQLVHWQRVAMAHAPVDTLLGFVPASVPFADRIRFVEAVRANAFFPSQWVLWAEIIYGEDEALTPEAELAVAHVGPVFFRQAVSFLGADGAAPDLPPRLKALGFSGKALFHGLRGALTGRLAGPELKDILMLMPRATLVRRLARFGTPDGENL
ncbi:MAG TPA: glutamate--tRNA ligase [Acidiferrobacter sp.]|nr:glutamate--tRNA ligase [Acidiferrobacter sp.]